MYDAVNALDVDCDQHGRSSALVPPVDAPARADAPAAAAAAGHAVLSALYPGQRPRLDALLDEQAPSGKHARYAQYANSSRDRGAPGRLAAGRAWGQWVGQRVVSARADDGAAPVEVLAASTEPGQFAAAWSGAQFRRLRPFAIRNPADYVTAGPPAAETVDYAGALAEVQVLGNAAITDPDKQAIYQYWSLGAGTVQPPGEWIKIALEVTAPRSLSLADRARLFALLGMALSDVVAPTVTTKFVYRHWRPTTAIRLADTDHSPYTRADASWSPRGGAAGSSPEHTSGHSAFSAAAATVLAGFLCNDDVAFSHVSDSAPGGAARRFSGFSAAAAEAGRSRVLGGTHFEFSNQAGLTAGRGVASEILSRMLLRRRGPTHLGSCPL
jgi:hypothetical protein